MAGDESELYVGKRFSSYVEVETWLEKYEDRVCHKFSRENSKTIEKCRVKNLPVQLRFYAVKLGCVCCGIPTSRGAGIKKRKYENYM